MKKEYKEIDSEGLVVEGIVIEEGEEIPKNCKPSWGSEESFYVPRWDSFQGKWVEQKSLTSPLDSMKVRKKEELSIACQEAILGRFPSTHGGIDYSFSYDKEAQLNFAERWNLFQNNMIPSIMLTAKAIPGDEVNRIQVNREEFTVIYLDSIKHKENGISRLQDLLMPMVSNAVSIKQLADIHWTSISVYPGEPSIEVRDDLTLSKSVETVGERANSAQESSDLVTMAFMEVMPIIVGGM